MNSEFILSEKINLEELDELERQSNSLELDRETSDPAVAEISLLPQPSVNDRLELPIQLGKSVEPALGLANQTVLGICAGLGASLTITIFLEFLPTFERVAPFKIADMLILIALGSVAGGLIGSIGSLGIGNNWMNTLQSNLIATLYQREADTKLKNTYLILLILLTVCFIISFCLHPDTNWLEDFSLNVASEILGIFLVVFSIDRVIDAEEDKKRRKKEKVGLQQLNRNILRYLYSLAKLVKNSSQPHPTLGSNKILELFESLDRQPILQAELYRAESSLRIQTLDPLDRLLLECSDLKDNLNKAIEKYSLFLQPEIISIIEETIDSLVAILAVREREGEANDLDRQQRLVASANIRDRLEKHLLKLTGLIGSYNQYVASKDKIAIEKLWLDHLEAEIERAIET